MEIVNGNYTLTNDYIQIALEYGIKENVPPSLFICQWWYESNFGNTSVAKNNNNWGGTSWFSEKDSIKRPSGVYAYRGTKRPTSEKGFYMRFNSVNDYMIDYFYLLLYQGIYNIKDNFNNFDLAVKGLFKVGGAKYDYAQAGYDEYLKTMQGVRFGINKRNDNILDKMDKNPNEYFDGKEVPVKPSEPNLDTVSNFVNGFTQNMLDFINELLTIDLYNFDNGQTFGNKYLQVVKVMDNMYKIKPTLTMGKVFTGIEDKGKTELDNILETIDMYPIKERYFPVDINNNKVNFWQRKNWKMGDLQYQMCYGFTRDNGNRFHSGYDIGTSGVSGIKCYAVVDSTVNWIKYNSNNGGFMIQLKHDNDKYYSTYLHLEKDSNFVNVGDKVKGGQAIGIIGNTGNVAYHLHYTLSVNEKITGQLNTINPESYLKITGDNKTGLKIPNDKGE